MEKLTDELLEYFARQYEVYVSAWGDMEEYKQLIKESTGKEIEIMTFIQFVNGQLRNRARGVWFNG